jgi:hypothetical protein
MINWRRAWPGVDRKGRVAAARPSRQRIVNLTTGASWRKTDDLLDAADKDAIEPIVRFFASDFSLENLE